MKKLLTLLFSLLLLTGCVSSDDSHYNGSYTLLKKGNCGNLVIHWEYPDSDFQYTSYDIDLTNFEPYIDESLSANGPGVNLNNLLGTLGYNRSFLSVTPIKITHENMDKIMKKKLNIYLNITDQQGEIYKVKLKYNKNIKDE